MTEPTSQAIRFAMQVDALNKETGAFSLPIAAIAEKVGIGEEQHPTTSNAIALLALVIALVSLMMQLRGN